MTEAASGVITKVNEPVTNAIEPVTNAGEPVTNADQPVTNADEPATGADYYRAYALLFVAHWFGANRFARINNPELFNPEDVEAYRSQKNQHIRRNFSRSVVKKPKKKTQAGSAEEGQPESPTQIGGLAKQVLEIVTLDQSTPWFVILQSVLMCGLWGVFALINVGEGKIGDGESEGPDPWLAGLDSISRNSTDLRWAGPECEDRRAEIFRWVTYQWTHVGAGHVLANTVVLVVFGFALEGHEGSLRMAVVWNTGVIVGALLWFVGGAHGYVVGTSGGVYALVGLQFADLMLNWRERHFRSLVLAILLVFTFFDLLTWLLSQELTDTNYSYSVNVGGGFAGVVMGSIIGRNYFVTDKDKRLTIVLSCLGFVLVIFCLVWLGAHDAPLNLWEVGNDGYCWQGQFYSRDIDEDNYVCVRCGTEECVKDWTARETFLTVKTDECLEQGWYYYGP